MSQYRDHHDAARHRVEALESKLAERDAELAAKGAALAERDAEIVRLRRELERVGTTMVPSRVKLASDPWTGRVVGAAVGLSMLAAILGVVVMRKAPSQVVVVAPTLADPPATPAPELAAPTPSPPDDMTNPYRGLEPPTSSPPDDEETLRRRLEPRVRSGRASVDEIKMLKAICSHQGDHACGNTAAAALAARLGN